MEEEIPANFEEADKETAIGMLNTTITSSTKTAIRITIGLARYIAKRQELENASVKQKCTAICFVHDGDQGTFGGYGDLYEYFLKNRILQGYFGEDEDFAKFGTPQFKNGKFRLLKFDQTYAGLHYDASDHPMFDPKEDTLLLKKRGPRGPYKIVNKMRTNRHQQKDELLKVQPAASNNATAANNHSGVISMKRRGRPRKQPYQVTQSGGTSGRQSSTMRRSKCAVKKLARNVQGQPSGANDNDTKSKQAKRQEPPNSAKNILKERSSKPSATVSCTPSENADFSEATITFGTLAGQHEENNNSSAARNESVQGESHSDVDVNNINLDANDLCPPPSPDLGFFGSQEMETSYDASITLMDVPDAVENTLDDWLHTYLTSISKE